MNGKMQILYSNGGSSALKLMVLKDAAEDKKTLAVSYRNEIIYVLQ